MWRKSRRKKKVMCLIVLKPSIMPIAHNLKLDARCDAEGGTGGAMPGERGGVKKADFSIYSHGSQ